VPDLDGLSLLAGLAAYGTYHHVLTHNLAFGGLVTAVSAIWIPRRARELALVFAAFCSHLVGDYFGSGPGWGLQPFLPFSDRFFLFAHAWELAGWQNFTITLGAITVSLVIAVRAGRTPLELFHAPTDRAIVEALRARFHTVHVRD
jgi:LexA-binding, inner membrane-associated putative hydrolase